MLRPELAIIVGSAGLRRAYFKTLPRWLLASLASAAGAHLVEQVPHAPAQAVHLVDEVQDASNSAMRGLSAMRRPWWQSSDIVARAKI